MGLELLLYGGTFDPPHEGHLKSAAIALQRFPEAFLWIMPTPYPPDIRRGGVKTPTIPFPSRVELCQLAFGESISTDRFEVSTIENELPPPHYTVATLRHLKSLTGQKKLGLLLGQDQLEQFHLWKEPLQILAMADLVVIGRQSKLGTAAHSVVDAGKQLLEKLGLTGVFIPDQQVLKAAGTTGEIHVIENAVSAATSSELRQKLRQGEVLPQGWLSNRVVGFIREGHWFDSVSSEVSRDSY